MAYTPQQWHDDTTSDPYGPISGDRLNYIESGIQAAAAAADAAGTAASGGAALGTAAPIINGVAAAGTSGSAAHEDHVHPTDTSRAALASPTFTGHPVGVTEAALNNSTRLATTAYADTAVGVETTRASAAEGLLAPLASPTFSGTPSLPTASVGVTQSAADSTTKLATTAFVTTADNLKANLAGPTFTGTVTLPSTTVAVTPSASDNSTKPATTAYVDTADALKANLAGPTFTGTVTLPSTVAGSPTFTGAVVLPSSTVTSAMIVDGTIVNADVNSAAAIAATKVSQPIPLDVMEANPGLANHLSSAATMTTLLVPTFYQVHPQGCTSFPLSGFSVRVGTLGTAATIGVGLYTVTFSGTQTISATRVAMLNAAISGTATGVIYGDATTGAAGSGAAVYTMDFTANRYYVGCMVSEVTNVQLTNSNFALTTGLLQTAFRFSGSSNGTARASTTDWPSSFDQTYVSSMSSTKAALVNLVTATGKQVF